jgi:hypothetical protein
MNTHAEKTQENKSQSVSTQIAQKQSGGSTFQFVDNRPEVVAQRKLQEMANNSPQVSQLRALQDMANNSPQAKRTAQLQAMADNHSAQQQPIQKKENNTGLPDNLKSGMENLSGISLDDVTVYRNSDKPAQLNAHAYAQGTDIHLGSGQEKHLPHEAWHVVQQKQGRVKPTMQMKGKVNVNDDAGLEKEADVMGAKAQQSAKLTSQIRQSSQASRLQNNTHTTQLKGTKITHDSTEIEWKGKKATVGKKVEANLDPNQKVMGSAVASGHEYNTDIDNLVAKCNSGAWARGHLLNHDLGGLGIPKNLFPITKGANRRHAHYVEYRVKDALAAAKEANKDENTNDEVYYEVEVRGNPSDAQFVCEWQYKDKDGKPKEINDKEINESAGKWIIPSKLKGPDSKAIPSDPYNNSPKNQKSFKEIIWHHEAKKGGAAADTDKVKWEAQEEGPEAILTGDDTKDYGMADGQMSEEERKKIHDEQVERMFITLKEYCQHTLLRNITSEIVLKIRHSCYPDKSKWREARPSEQLKVDYKNEFENAIASLIDTIMTFIEKPEVREACVKEDDKVYVRKVVPLFRQTGEYVRMRDELADKLIAKEEVAKQERQREKKEETEEHFKNRRGGNRKGARDSDGDGGDKLVMRGKGQTPKRKR